jgi:hypothetical protein
MIIKLGNELADYGHGLFQVIIPVLILSGD